MSQGVVVCVDPRTAETGAEILEAGDNAFDDAVAVAFAQTVVLPFSCGTGSFMSANLRRADGEHRIVDGCLRTGARVTEEWRAPSSCSSTTRAGSTAVRIRAPAARFSTSEPAPLGKSSCPR